MTKASLTNPCPGACGAASGQPCEPDCGASLFNDLTNTDRAETAHTALTAFADVSYDAPMDRDLTHHDTVELVARDLVSDLLHLLDRHDIHPGRLLTQAYDAYRAEHLEDDPGHQPPTTSTLGCPNGCGVAPGIPCLWGCPTWEHTPAT